VNANRSGVSLDRMSGNPVVCESTTRLVVSSTLAGWTVPSHPTNGPARKVLPEQRVSDLLGPLDAHATLLRTCDSLCASPCGRRHPRPPSRWWIITSICYKSAASPPKGFALTAADLIRQMDEARIQRGVVLSIAYQFGNPNRPPVANERQRVQTENDWTAEQAALYPKRLVAFCGVNPLKDYAMDEIARCAKNPRLRKGLKLHFGNSDVDLENPAHLAQLRRVFAEANRHRMAIVAHIRANYDKRRPWGDRQARIFIEQLLPAAKDIPVQIAHLAGAGAYEDDVDAALGAFASAVQARDKRLKRVYFDVSVMRWESKADSLVQRLRTIGMQRLLYASDGPPLPAHRHFRKLPLTARELRQIENNVAPYLR
jgi:predicted TIM-barrel fold metal-dependent hydrolase